MHRSAAGCQAESTTQQSIYSENDEDLDAGGAPAGADDDRGVVQLVGDDQTPRPRQHRQHLLGGMKESGLYIYIYIYIYIHVGVWGCGLWDVEYNQAPRPGQHRQHLFGG